MFCRIDAARQKSSPIVDLPTPGRAATMQRFLALYPDYRPLYRAARRVVGDASSPYGATLAIESWLRTTGKYTQHPPNQGPQPLLDFVLRTKRGYCQHFAGAMALMLRYLGYPDTAERVEHALRDVIAAGETVTYDLGGSAGTSQFADAIIERLGAIPTTATPA